MNKMATSCTRTPAPRVIKFTIFVDPSLVIITTLLHTWSYLCLGVEKKSFKEIMHFHFMTYMATPQQKKNTCPVMSVKLFIPLSWSLCFPSKLVNKNMLPRTPYKNDQKLTNQNRVYKVYLLLCTHPSVRYI